MKKVIFGAGNHSVNTATTIKDGYKKNIFNQLLIGENKGNGIVGELIGKYKGGEEVSLEDFDVVFEFENSASCQVVIDALQIIKLGLQSVELKTRKRISQCHSGC